MRLRSTRLRVAHAPSDLGRSGLRCRAKAAGKPVAAATPQTASAKETPSSRVGAESRRCGARDARGSSSTYEGGDRTSDGRRRAPDCPPGLLWPDRLAPWCAVGAERDEVWLHLGSLGARTSPQADRSHRAVVGGGANGRPSRRKARTRLSDRTVKCPSVGRTERGVRGTGVGGGATGATRRRREDTERP